MVIISQWSVHTELCIKLTTFMLTQIYTLRYTDTHTATHRYTCTLKYTSNTQTHTQVI